MEPQKPCSILLVDNDEYSCEIISSILAVRFPHIHIHNVQDGKAGLESFRKYLPNIVIIESNLPGMDGIRLLDNLSAIKADTRAIMLLSHYDSRFIERISLCGVAIELVPKPVDLEILIASIGRCIASISRVPSSQSTVDTIQ